MVTENAALRVPLLALTLAGWLVLGGCGKHTDAPDAGADRAAPRASTSTATGRARSVALLSAEQRRASRDVLDADLSDRDVVARRAATRALSRIADTRSAELLAKSLADEDPEVVAWSAYGLGYSCRGREATVVKTLAARAASLLTHEAAANGVTGSNDAGAPKALASPLASVAGALARCGTPEAERTLRAWLAAERSLAEDAALGLGTIAIRTGRLDDATLVALLDAASRPKAPIEAALYPFARLPSVGAPVQKRLLEVVRSKLGVPGLGRAFAIRALATAGDEAAPELARVVASPGFDDAERADAARALGRLGTPGQRSLDTALETLLAEPTATSDAALASSRFGVLSSLLDALTLPLEKSAPLLARLAELPAPAAPAARRRVVALRCRSAELLAGRGTLSPKLLTCDPDPNGRAGRLAFVRVLDRGPLKGARLRRFTELLRSTDGAVRQRTLELLATHPEARGAPAFLSEALASKSPGDVATAAELIAKHPDRAATALSDKPVSHDADAGTPEPSLAPPAPAPDAAVVRALTKALDDWSKASEIEVRTALADAAGALELLGANDRLELDCKSPHPALRQHAEKALARLGQRDRRCDTFEPDYAPPAELAHALSAPQKLTFETDAGPLEIELDPTFAPVAATRLADLARSGFFEGVVVHRVVPGFVVQLGDPGGDGYGGAKGPPLRCETAPVPFEAGTVGIALGGRDTGSSQFFVSLGRHPHLDGEYAVVGRAGAGWSRVAEGDVVRKARVGD
jgi:cyclophilin family peptidyl-prolyl cis-trans isomerase/HEAT repeat protein